MSRYLLERVGAPHYVLASCASIDGAIHEARALSRNAGAVLVRDSDDKPATVRGVAEEGVWMAATACKVCRGKGATSAGSVGSYPLVANCQRCMGVGYRCGT